MAPGGGSDAYACVPDLSHGRIAQLTVNANDKEPDNPCQEKSVENLG
jgi:hypothetical protein